MDKEILSMEEAAELFGVSVKTFIKLLKEEKVPARKIGREWRFSRNALIHWLSSGDSQMYSSSEGEAKEFFDEIAPRWEEVRKNYYDESIKNRLLDLKLLKKSMIAMDLGSGDGYLSRSVAKHVKKVIAVDISGEMIKELARKAQDGGLKNIETLKSDGQDIPIHNSSVDAVLSSMYLHHIEKPELAIKEMFRVLKPGGIVFLADFSEHNDKEFVEQMHDLWFGFQPQHIGAIFEDTGFQRTSLQALTNTKEVVDKNHKEVFILTAYKPKI